jgi:hypothetical protein
MGTVAHSRASNIGAPRYAIVLRISASQTTYNEGEPIQLKVEAINISGDEVLIRQVAPWHAVTLAITRDGAAVPRTGSVLSADWPFSADAKVQPGRSYIFQWREATPPYTPIYYNPISDWGYRLLPPGKYTIVAYDYDASTRTHHHSLDVSANEPSNVLHITVQR